MSTPMHTADSSCLSDGASPRKVVLIVNPTTVDDVTTVVTTVRRSCSRFGWAEPHLLTTTVEDPGAGAARTAVSEGAQLVLCCGGDGTLASVATGLANTGVPVGILPTGTGNLLGRNLDLPLDLDEALTVALAEHSRVLTLDMGRIGDHNFAVMAGMGVDAAIMRDTRPAVKTLLGWPAYVLAGIGHLGDRPMATTIRLDGQAPMSRRARTVLVGNVGLLQGGIPVLPDADPTDGVLDIVLVAPRTVLGWCAVAWHLLRRNTGDGPEQLERFRARRVEISTERPHPWQFDGDFLGPTRSLTIDIEPAALLVKAPV